MDILDRDLYDSAPHTPGHTSWSMDVLRRLDGVTGAGVTERPIFAFPGQGPAAAARESGIVQQLRRGDFDPLFKGAPHTASALWAEIEKAPPRRDPMGELMTESSFRPASQARIEYPALAKAARVDAQVAFRLKVALDGSVADLRITHGHPLFDDAVTTAVRSWRFPSEAMGREFEGVIDFRTNCRLTTTSK